MILLWLSLAFIAGIIAGGPLALPAPAFLVPALVAVLAAWRVPAPKLRPVLLLLAALLLGLARGGQPPARITPSSLLYYAGRTVTVQGVVDAEPDVRDTGVLYVVRATAVTVGATTHPVSGRMQIRTPRSQLFDYGDSLQVRGQLLIPRNTSTLPYRDILARSGIAVEMRYPAVIDLGPTDAGPLGWIMALRSFIERGIDSWLPEPEAALLIAITLGAKSASLGNLAPILVTTGLIHIVAISGIKVAMVAGTLYGLARRTGIRFLTLLLSLAGLAGYVILTGATVSGMRSAAMWALVFLALYLGRATLTLISLAFVAAVMVGLDPSLPADPAFQLSTVGTFAIVTLAGPLRSVFRFVPTPLNEALTTTLAAQIGTLPVVLAGFHVLSWTGPLANMVVLPLLPLLIVLGFALALVAGFSHLAAPVAAVCYALLHSVVVVAQIVARLGSLPQSGLPGPMEAAYYLALAGIAFVILRRFNWVPDRHRPALGAELALALLAGTVLAATTVFAAGDARNAVYWLGTGDATLIESHGQTALIDGGPKPFVLMERLGSLLPSHQRTIGLVVVTDPRATNVTALLDLLGHYRIGEVLDVGVEYSSLTYARWRAGLDVQHVPVYALRTGARARVGSITITALGPDAVYPNPRDCIGLLRVSIGRTRILFVGPASLREQNEALFRSVDLHAGTLVAAGPLESSFIAAVHASRVWTTAPTGFFSPTFRVLGTTPQSLLGTTKH